MKAKELMIGDWVKVRNSVYAPCDNKRGYIHSISYGCDVIFENHADHIYGDDDIEPIPLTAEILAKNGWKWDNTQGEYVSSAFSLEWDIDTHEAWLRIGREFTIITYVHELQHALRLCGLTKLADNFKA